MNEIERENMSDTTGICNGVDNYTVGYTAGRVQHEKTRPVAQVIHTNKEIDRMNKTEDVREIPAIVADMELNVEQLEIAVGNLMERIKSVYVPEVGKDMVGIKTNQPSTELGQRLATINETLGSQVIRVRELADRTEL